MIPQSAAAVPARASAATAAGAAAGAPGVPGTADGAAVTADLLLTLLAGDAAPFSQALAALRADPAASSAKVVAGTIDAKDGADPASSADATLSDATAAALAGVLQWLQQQTGVNVRAAATDGGADDQSVGAAGDAATSGIAGLGGAQASGATSALPGGGPASTLDAALTPAVGTTIGASGAAGQTAPPSFDPADGPASDARSAAGAAAPAADSTAAGPGMDLAVALRAAAAATGANPVERSIPVPVHDRHWPQAVAAQLLLMNDQKVQVATLRLAPEHLGPLEVRIDLQDSRVDVAFAAAHAETRAALEQSIPQLREVLAGSGLTLGQASVQQQMRRESQNPAAAVRPAAPGADPQGSTAAVVRLIGMVDEYV